MFLFSSFFYFSPLFTEADTTIWSYTGETGGIIAKYNFKTKPECDVSLLKYKEQVLSGKTTPCESSISYAVEAAKPTMTASLFREQQDGSTGKFAWVLQIKTANISNGVVITGAVYDTGANSTIIDRNTATVNNNSATYYTKGSILENNKEYMLVLNATNDQKISTNVWFTKTVGKEDSTISTREIDLTSTPVLVAPQTNTATGSDTYNLLAPIGGMDTAPNDMGDYFNKIFLIAIGLCGALAVVMLIIGGIQYMGEDSVFGKTKAKEQITSAVFGLLIALGAYALLNTINPALLGRGGINIKSVTISIDSETETEPWTGTAILTQATKTCTEGYENVQTTGIPKTINVCKSISGNLTKMLAEAAKKGFVLSGSGSRTYEQQKALRIKNNCKPDILTSPSKSCSPETARPGYSKHESGKAVDFNCAGEKMKGSVCFNWLVTNAKSFGFYNLSGEPWHWSDNGH